MTTKTNTLVTYETVAQACEALSAEGKRPSVRAILAQLGGGSPNAVLDHQRQWKAGRPTVKSADIQVDPRIGLIVAEQIAQAVAAARADIEAQLAESEQDAETVGKAGREAEERASALAEELEAAKAKLQAMAGQIDQLNADAEKVKAEAGERVKAAEERACDGIAKAEDEARREREAREAAQMQMAKAELRLEALPRLEAEIDQMRAEIAQERKARQAAEQGAAVAVEKASGLAERLTEAKARIAVLEKAEEKLAALTDSYHKQQGELLAANMAVAQAGGVQLTNGEAQNVKN
jgi:colicin import membrane protein